MLLRFGRSQLYTSIDAMFVSGPCEVRSLTNFDDDQEVLEVFASC